MYVSQLSSRIFSSLKPYIGYVFEILAIWDIHWKNLEDALSSYIYQYMKKSSITATSVILNLLI